jgi:uncharacterized protein with PIN domain
MSDRMRFMIDANVNHAVGDLLLSRGYEVDFVNQSFLPKTPDSDIDAVARRDGLIIVSYDQQFLKKIQQPRFGFIDPASSGYGRIMLMIRLSQQVARMDQCFDMIEHVHAKALVSGRRLLITVGLNFIRYDDEPLPRTPKTPIPSTT